MSITTQRVIFWGTLAVLLIAGRLGGPMIEPWLHALSKTVAG